MTLSFAALPALALLAAPALAQDDGGLYLELGAGLTSTESMPGLIGDAAFDTGSSFNGLIGYEWQDAWAGLNLGLEFEGLWTLQNFEDELLGSGSSLAEDFTTSAYLFGPKLTWPYSEEISFYGGLGVGFTTELGIKSRGDAASAFKVVDEETLLYQAKAGIRYNMGANLSWYLQYRHVVADTVEVEDDFLLQSFDYDFEQDLLEVGMRYGF